MIFDAIFNRNIKHIEPLLILTMFRQSKEEEEKDNKEGIQTKSLKEEIAQIFKEIPFGSIDQGRNPEVGGEREGFNTVGSA